MDRLYSYCYSYCFFCERDFEHENTKKTFAYSFCSKACYVAWRLKHAKDLPTFSWYTSCTVMIRTNNEIEVKVIKQHGPTMSEALLL